MSDLDQEGKHQRLVTPISNQRTYLTKTITKLELTEKPIRINR